MILQEQDQPGSGKGKKRKAAGMNQVGILCYQYPFPSSMLVQCLTNQVVKVKAAGEEIEKVRREMLLLDQEYVKVYQRLMTWRNTESDFELETHTKFCHHCLKLMSSPTVLKTQSCEMSQI